MNERSKEEIEAVVDKNVVSKGSQPPPKHRLPPKKHYLTEERPASGKFDFVTQMKGMKKTEILEWLDTALYMARQPQPVDTKLEEAQLAPEEGLRYFQKAMYSSEFADMVAMKAFNALEERLKEDPAALQLVSSMYMLLLYQRYAKENQEGLVLWFNNQAASEAIGEISHLVKWEVE